MRGHSPVRWLSAAAAAFVLVAPAATARQRPPSNRGCVECHRASDEDRLSRPVVDFETDVHAELGFGCLDCHGPDPTGTGQAVETTSGFLSKPTRRGVIEMCGRCHSNAEFMRDYNPATRVDQVSRYATSVHGQLLAERNDPNVAVCESCHPAHQIKPATELESSVHPLNVATTCGACHADPERMAAYGIPTDQQEQYEQSVHWIWMSEEADLSAPTCNDCHGNHGAAPPGVASVEIVCGECHTFMADYFGDGPHEQYFIEADLPGCATCHGNHAIGATNDNLLLELNEAVCHQCHAEGEVGHDEFPQVKALIDSLQAEVITSREALEEAENLGMEVSQAQFDLEDVTNALVQARTAIHTFSVDSVRLQVEAGLAITASGHERAEEALREHLFRRQGLAVSVVLILMVIAGIALLIRDIERRNPPGAAPRTNHEP